MQWRIINFFIWIGMSRYIYIQIYTPLHISSISMYLIYTKCMLYAMYPIRVRGRIRFVHFLLLLWHGINFYINPTPLIFSINTFYIAPICAPHDYEACREKCNCRLIISCVAKTANLQIYANIYIKYISSYIYIIFIYN